MKRTVSMSLVVTFVIAAASSAQDSKVSLKNLPEVVRAGAALRQGILNQAIWAGSMYQRLRVISLVIH